jgi:hypothetical protein
LKIQSGKEKSWNSKCVLLRVVMAKYKQPDPEQGQFVVLNFSELFLADHPVPRLLETSRSFDLSKFD